MSIQQVGTLRAASERAQRLAENQQLFTIFVCHPASALSRRSETCDISSDSVNSREIKTPRSLRSLRETYNHHTDVFFPHAETAKTAKIL